MMLLLATTLFIAAAKAQWVDLMYIDGPGTFPGAPYTNTYPYYWKAGDVQPSGSPGKYTGYDTEMIDQLRFVLPGAEAVFDLGQCDTLVNIMAATGVDHNSLNDGTAMWNSGHAKFMQVSSTDTVMFPNDHMTIAQGDQSADSNDWVVFGFLGEFVTPGPQPGWKWNNPAIGCENYVNMCTPGQGRSNMENAGATNPNYANIMIKGRSCSGSMPAPPASGSTVTNGQFVDLMYIAGPGVYPASYSNQYPFYWKAGDVDDSVGTNDEGKRKAYDNQMVDQLKFVLPGAVGVFDLGQCDTLVNIMAATGINERSKNFNTANWRQGHAKFMKVYSNDKKMFPADHMTIAQGDGDYDYGDWAVMGFIGENVTPKKGWGWKHPAVGCEDVVSMCTPKQTGSDRFTQGKTLPAYANIRIQGRTCGGAPPVYSRVTCKSISKMYTSSQYGTAVAHCKALSYCKAKAKAAKMKLKCKAQPCKKIKGSSDCTDAGCSWNSKKTQCS